MYKVLIKDASLYSISSVLARGLSFITVPIFTRILSPADYGALDLLSYFAVFFPLIFGLALDQGVARYYVASKDSVEKKATASSVLIYTVIALLIVVLSAMPFSEILARDWLGGQVDSSTVRMVFAYVWVHSVFLVLNNQLRYMFLAKKYAACNIGNTVVSMGFSIWFVAFRDMGVYGFFLAQTIGQSCFAALSFYYSRESYALIFDWSIFNRLLKYSLPLVPSTVAFLGMQYVDRYTINELRTLQEVGLYGIGARLASLVNLFLNGFHSAWYPMVMKTYQEEGAITKFRTVFNYYVFVTCSILVVISLFSEEILLLLTTNVFSEGYIVVPLLISSAILSSIGNYFSFGIQIKERSAIRLYINLCGLTLNVFLNIILVKNVWNTRRGICDVPVVCLHSGSQYVVQPKAV